MSLNNSYGEESGRQGLLGQPQGSLHLQPLHRLPTAHPACPCPGPKTRRWVVSLFLQVERQDPLLSGLQLKAEVTVGERGIPAKTVTPGETWRWVAAAGEVQFKMGVQVTLLCVQRPKGGDGPQVLLRKGCSRKREQSVQRWVQGCVQATLQRPVWPEGSNQKDHWGWPMDGLWLFLQCHGVDGRNTLPKERHSCVWR